MSIDNYFNQAKAELTQLFGDRILFDEPIAPYVAYQVGGPADALFFPKEESDLISITRFACQHQIPISIIGTGTNLLVSDKGIRGITLSLEKAFQEITPLEQTQQATIVQCGGGVQKPALLEWAIEQNLAGLEFSAGVPGTIGGGIFMNAGTKYGTYGNILIELRIFDFNKGPMQLNRNEIEFGYRTQSVIQSSLVQWVSFRLTPGNGELIQKEVDRIIQERAEKQPLDFPSCGSTFKNPPGYSAGRLIEKSGLKGLTSGGAEISTKHANFILNKGGATAEDILTLISKIQQTVREKFEVSLETEVIVLGDGYAEGEIPTAY